MSGASRILRGGWGSSRPSLRIRAFSSASTGRSGDGGSGSSSSGDFKIDFSKYFTTPPSDSSSSSSSSPSEASNKETLGRETLADETLSRETLDLSNASVENGRSTSEGDDDAGKSGKRLWTILPGEEEKSEGPSPTNKFKLDLKKLFMSAEQNAARAPGVGSGNVAKKPFKLDLSSLKNLSSSDENAKFKSFRPNTGRFAKPTASNLSDSARRELSLQKLGHLSRFGSPQSSPFNISAPKEHLLEKYFSLENMSVAECHKIELRSARESFKIHDADCGSTPVQISTLTQKIKHLSNHLSTNKKDKHSRKGLEAMIEKRRRLLMYLRRKDWDTYCYVLSTLGLRDKLEVAHA